jgi:hypothetical protein
VFVIVTAIARKLLEPLSTIIQNTCAKSLQYECIHTVTLALPFTKRDDGSDSKNAPAVVKLCSDYLRVSISPFLFLSLLKLRSFHPHLLLIYI